MAGDVVTARTAGSDVTQDLPRADDGVASAAGMPETPQTKRARRSASRQQGSANSEPAAPGTEARDAGDDLDHEDSDAIEADRTERSDHSGRSPGGRRSAARSSSGGGKKSAARAAASRVTRRAAAPADTAATAETQPDAGSGAAAMRRRLARLGSPRGGTVNPVLEPLIRSVRTTHPKADVRLIERAYEAAARLHAGQSRRSGDPYITHPLAVATILAELGMPHDTICAALLHDTSRTPSTPSASCARSSART